MNKIYPFLIIVLFFFSCQGPNVNDITQNKIEQSLLGLQNKNYGESWVVISAGFEEEYIQFFSGDSVIYFDIPERIEMKNKYRDNRFAGKIDSTGKNTFFMHYLSNKQEADIISLLRGHDLSTNLVRAGFIEPTLQNQTDTTGWITSIRGKFDIKPKNAKRFIDEYFEKIFKLNKDSIRYTIDKSQ